MNRNVLLTICFALSMVGAAFGSCSAPQNQIEAENCNTGTTGWEVGGLGDLTIQGFSTDISVNAGQTIYFKISTPATSYHIDIYRMGYYGGTGGRYITTVQPSATLPQSQPACLTNPATQLYDCGNWGVSASWTVPANAVSGIYIAAPVRDTGGASQIVFIVRNDSSHSAILFQTSDETWQAYNGYGGHSVYGPTDGFDLTNRAYKVSYNRPSDTRTFASEAATWVFGEEYPMVRWLEANGYDVTYFTGLDAARNGSLIRNHKLYLSIGHDEYWSGPQRTNVETARDAGVNLAFFSGNEVFWKTRWENSIDGTNTPYRTLVCYKETVGPNSTPPGTPVVDPLDPPTWTGTWRDPSKSPPADGGRPENSLTGTIFMVNGPATDNPGTLSIKVPAADGKMRFWRNTTIANLAAGQTATLPAETLGYEWDEDLDNGARPAGTFDLSFATYNLTADLLLDQGGIYGAGTATHQMTLHRAPSGALVFGAGTVQWAWGLDANHDNPFGSNQPADPDMQQATANLFADMGIEPATLQPGLIFPSKSADTTPPVSTITSPSSGATLQFGIPVTVTGTAVDEGGGVVGGVEVSTDGGQTWHPASGRESWSYSWTPLTSGSINVLSRAVDDSANLELPSAGIGVTVPKPPISTDAQVSSDGSSASTTIQSPSFSTSTGNELVLAFITTDYLTGTNTTVTNVSGGGLTWALVVRANGQGGDSEIWRAFATSPISGATVTATLSQSVVCSITVRSFEGVNTSGTNGSGAIGATASKSATASAPSASVTTTQNSSWVFGVGNDFDNAIPRTPGSGQSLVHQDLTAAGDTYWVQMQNSPTYTAGTSVPINDTAPTTDRWNLAVVEIVPAPIGNLSISGTISPVSAGAGASVVLTGTVRASVTADASGNFSFGSLPNGSYVVTPNQAGFVFTPSSKPVTLSGASATGINFSGAQAFSISGTISPATSGNGTLVTLSGASGGTTTADGSGNYSFNNLVNGSYTVTPSKAGFTFNPALQNVTVNGGDVPAINFTAQVVVTVNVVLDAKVSADGSSASLTIASPVFSTASGSELLLAFISTDYLTGTNTSVTGVTGGGLTWTLVVRTNAQKGGAEVWKAFATAPLNNVTVTATLSQSIISSITLMSFTGVDTTGTGGSGAIGATASKSGATGAPTATVVTTRNNSWVFGVGNDFDNAIARTAATGQSLVHQDLTSAGDTYWVQMQNSPTPTSGTSVTINDTAPTSDSYNLSLVEILPSLGPYSISGNISPALSGATVTLSGTVNGTNPSDGSGNYSFIGLPNGSYTVTPSKSGTTFTPSSQPVTINGNSVTGVNFAVVAPVLTVTPSGLAFTTLQGGGSPAPGSVSITNTGGSTLSFTVASDSAWLTATPTSGSAPQTLQVTATSTGLTPGAYLGHLTITAPGASQSPATVTVRLNVTVQGDWLMVDHDIVRSGNATDETTISASNVNNLHLRWSTVVDGSVTTQPLYVHSVQIGAQTRDLTIVGTAGNTLFALDANTGAVIWSRNFGPPDPNNWAIPDGFGIEAPPIVDRTTNRVYTVSTDGMFRTLSLIDGTDAAPAFAMIVNPVTNKVWGGLNKLDNYVYVASASNGGDVAPWRGQVYQVDISATPKLVGDFVVVPSIAAPNGGGGIWGYGGVSADPTTGNIYAASADDSIVTGGHEGYTPYSDSMIALSSNVGLLGYYQAPQPSQYTCSAPPCDLDFASTPIVFQPTGCPTMLAAGNKNGNLYLFRSSDLIASGQPLQVLTLNVPNDSLGGGGIGGVPAYSPSANMLFITDAGPGVTGVSAGIVGLNVTASCTLQVAWSHPLSGNNFPNSTPTIGNGLVYVGEGSTGIVHAYNAQTGTELWNSGTQIKSASTFAAPTIANGTVYVGSWTAYTGGGIVGAFGLNLPVLSVSPMAVPFAATVGGSNPQPATVNVTNTGSGTLSFTAASDSTWLAVSPGSGTAPQSLQLSASITGLAVGTYTGHITVTSTGTQGSPAVVTVTLTVSSASSGLAIDAKLSKDTTTAATTIASPAFSTKASNELLLAFVSTDYLSGANTTVTGIASSGLTWTLVIRTNAQSGSSEVWRAFATAPLTNVTATATLSQSVLASMTVISFTGVDTTGTNGSGAIGATLPASAKTGAPTATVVTTRNNSWVFGVGNDYDNAIARTPGTNQTVVHQDLTSTGDTYWVQMQNSTTTLSGTSVTINDTAPTTDRYNLSIVEVRTP